MLLRIFFIQLFVAIRMEKAQMSIRRGIRSKIKYRPIINVLD